MFFWGIGRFPERRPGGYFKHRKEAVAAPVDLVPAEMREVRLESIWNGRFYTLTFRKPAALRTD
ncbi:MAG: hypothetical protein ABSC05_06455 [Candidatus Solibacter sp.]|jgi:hypothetical protein